MKRLIKLFAIFVISCSVQAEVWKDYSPSESVTELTVVTVKPNYFDDYITNLKKTWVKAMGIQKEMGVIEDYRVWVGSNADKPNVFLTVRYKNMAAMQGSEAQYDEFMKRFREAGMSEDENETVSKGYEEYREIVDRKIIREVVYK